MSTLKFLSFSIALSMLLGVNVAKSDTTKQFKDWQVICDNGGNCQGVANDSNRDNLSTTYRLEIARQQGRDTYWTISFTMTGDEPTISEPFHISVDFEQPLRLEPEDDYQSSAQPGRFDIIGISRGNSLMRLFAKGNEAFFNFLNSRGQETAARFSLKGLSASLLWIDDQQKRLKSPRAIGDIKTVSMDKKAKKPNAFTAGNTTVLAPDKIPPAVAKVHFADGECATIENSPLAGFGFETAPLDKTRTLYLIPCFAGAYNIVYRAYVKSIIEDKPRLLLFAEFSDEMGWSGTNSLLNISYDAKTKSLSAFAKGRGLGDCGSSSLYQWADYAFKLMEYRYWGKCNGTKTQGDWPVIYQSVKP